MGECHGLVRSSVDESIFNKELNAESRKKQMVMATIFVVAHHSSCFVPLVYARQNGVCTREKMMCAWEEGHGVNY